MKLLLTPEAEKQFANLQKTEQKKILKKLLVIQNKPYSGIKLEGKLAGRRRIRAWPYRIIYIINEEKNRVEVSAILHRQGAYK